MNAKQPKPVEPDSVIEAYKRDIDRSILRENLRLTVEQRFRNLQQLQRFADELRTAPRNTDS
jgi:hypothetical protein